MLDIKSKNSNKARRTGILIVFCAAFIMVWLFPYFDMRASTYYEEMWGEGFEGEFFVSALLQSNFVLYKDAMDRSGDKKYGYQELYMDEQLENVAAAGTGPGSAMFSGSGPETETVSGNDMFTRTPEYMGGETVDYQQLNSILELYVDQLENAAAGIRAIYVDEIQSRMDYCVLEKTTGTVLKNTALDIEKLAQDGQDGEKDYAYYVIMEYDEAGNLNNLRVKSKDADRLLKNTQIAAGSKVGKILPDREETETYLLYDYDEEEWKQILTLRQKKPVNTTFIYAMTQEQIEVFAEGNSGFLLDNFGLPSKEYIYYTSGADSVYFLLLTGILGIVVLLALWKPERLEGKAKRTVPFEAMIFLAVVLYGFGVEITSDIVRMAGNDQMLDWLNANFPANMQNSMGYELIEKSVCFLLFAALFGVGYWCFLELSDMIKGFGEYVKTRSLIYRYWKEICGFFKGLYQKLKKEVLSVDLGKDNNKTLWKIIFFNFLLLTVVCLFWGFGIFMLAVYSLILYGLLKNYIFKIRLQYGKLLKATNSIAQGNLNNEFKEDFGIFESYKEELYKIQGGFKNAVDQEVKSQKMKTELITNVSHDLKTPLTAIITYIDLLKQENLTEEQRKEYLDTLERKSLRLKVLIEDLFEVSKATSGAVKLEPVPVDICNLVRQVYLEHEEKMKEAGLEVRFRLPEEKIILSLDPQKTYRIFENLYTNIIKYALTGTRVFVTAEKIPSGYRQQENEMLQGLSGTDDAVGYAENGTGVHIELKNISAREINVTPQELTERFVRGDASRNTEGSGLGLAIAKNFVELQGGKFRIETDGDLFKAVIDWQVRS